MIAVIFITGLIIFLLSFRKFKFCFEWHAKLNRRPSKLKKKAKQSKIKNAERQSCGPLQLLVYLLVSAMPFCCQNWFRWNEKAATMSTSEELSKDLASNHMFTIMLVVYVESNQCHQLVNFQITRIQNVLSDTDRSADSRQKIPLKWLINRVVKRGLDLVSRK